jgi:hypothetical protein
MVRKVQSTSSPARATSRRPNRIISGLRRGKLTAGEAIAELKRRRLPKLIQSPEHPEDYDPQALPFWTPLQAVAWIAFRDPAIVRHVSKEYRAQKTTLVEIGPAGAQPARLDKAEVGPVRTTVVLDLYVAYRKLPGNTIEEAIESLQSELRAKANRLIATGIANGERKEIDRSQWADLRFFVDREDPEVVAFEKMRFKKVLLPREEVMSIWPPNEASISAEIECIDKLVELMKASPDNPEPKHLVHKRDFSKMPFRAFESAWKAAVRNSGANKWSKGGRRPNNRST